MECVQSVKISASINAVHYLRSMPFRFISAADTCNRERRLPNTCRSAPPAAGQMDSVPGLETARETDD